MNPVSSGGVLCFREGEPRAQICKRLFLWAIKRFLFN